MIKEVVWGAGEPDEEVRYEAVCDRCGWDADHIWDSRDVAETALRVHVKNDHRWRLGDRVVRKKQVWLVPLEQRQMTFDERIIAVRERYRSTDVDSPTIIGG